MFYQGRVLCMTYFWLPGGPTFAGYHPRWGFVSDEYGNLMEADYRGRHETVQKPPWVKIGTWEITKVPKDMWDVAKAVKTWEDCMEPGCTNKRRPIPGPPDHSPHICPFHRHLYEWIGMRWVRKAEAPAPRGDFHKPSYGDDPDCPF